MNALPEVLIQVADTYSCEDQPARLDASAVGGIPPYEYRWEPQEGLSDPNSPVTFAAPDSSTTYTVFVVDAVGRRSSHAVHVERRDNPVAVIGKGAITTMCAEAEVALDGARSVDTDGNPVVTWEWEVDGKRLGAFDSPELPAFVPVNGQRVRLTVTDERGCVGSVQETLEVRPLPSINVSFDVGAPDACEGGVLEWSVEATDADGAPLASIEWDLDGDPSTIEATGAQSGPFDPFNGTVSITATDELGCSFTLRREIEVHAPPTPVIEFPAIDSRVCLGASVSLDGSASLDTYGAEPVSWEWDWDGDPSTVEWTDASTPPLTIDSPTTVTLTVVDERGCRSSATKVIDTRPLPSVSIGFEKGSPTECTNDPVVLFAEGFDSDGGLVSRFEWDLDGDPSTIEATGAMTPELRYEGETVVQVRAVDAFGCSATSSLGFTPRPLPEARIEFIAGRENVCAGDAIQLSGASSRDHRGDPVVAWEWTGIDADFGDPTSPETSPFIATAFSTIGLTVTAANGCKATTVQAIEPRPLPEVRWAFARGSESICSGDTVELIDDGSRDADGKEVVSWSWDLDGDGAPDALGPSTGDFVPNGSEVVLTVIDALGCENSVRQSFDIGALPTPVIAFTQGANAACEGDDVVVDGSGSTDASGNPVASYEWDWDGDPSSIEFTGAQPPPMVVDGERTIRLRVTDARGCFAEAVETVVPLSLPTARIAFAQGRDNVCLGDAVQVDGSSSTDGAGESALTYAWDLDGDGVIDATDARPPPFTPLEPRTVHLTVTDANGCSSQAAHDIAPRDLPTPRVAFVEGGEFVCSGATVALDASASTDADGNPVTGYSWEWDGDPSTLEASDALSGAFEPASGQVELRVVDALGCSATVSQSIEVGALPTPVIAFTRGANAACEGDDVVVDGSGSTDASGNPVASYEWDWDGDPSSIEFTGAQPPPMVVDGERTIRLRVTDARGCFAEAVETVAALSRPTARISFTQGHASACMGDEVILSGEDSTSGGGGPVASWAWDIDGDPASIESTDATLPPLTFESNTTIRLLVTDANGCEARAETRITPRPLPQPRISFDAGSPDHCSGDTVVLSGATSTDADGNATVEFAWDLETDGSEDHFDVTTPSLTSTSPRTVSLRVRDAQGCEATTSSSLSPRPLPTPQISFVQGHANVCAGNVVELSAAGTVDADGQPVTSYAWDLDGDSETVESSSVSSGVWTPQGAPARLTVTDTAGCSATVVQDISPRALPTPRLSFALGGEFVCEGESVSLDASESTDADGQQVTSFAWDLDGDPGTIEETTASTGPFSPTGPVRLTVTDAQGCFATLTRDIEVGGLPQPRIDYLDGASAVCSGGRIVLDGSNSVDALGGSALSFEWEWDGDESTVESTDPIPPGFALDGNRTVRLRVTDTLGCSAEAFEELTARALPVANISFLSGHQSSCHGELVTLTGALSTDASGNPVNGYEWSFSGDFTSIESTDDTLSPFTALVDRTAWLRVTDTFGCVDETAVSLSPRALPTPRISFEEGHANSCSGDTVRVSGAGSTDADGNAVASWEWDLDGDGSAEHSGVTPPAFHPNQPRTIALGVTDSQGCFASASELVEPRPLPTVGIEFLQGAHEVCAGDPVNLSAAASRDADGQPVVAYSWDLQGTGGVHATGASTGLYVPDGSPARVTVTDAFGCEASGEQPIRPRNSPTPVISYVAGNSGQLCSGEEVELSAINSVDADGNPVVAYAWDLNGDGVADLDTESTGSFVPANSQAVRLTVSDSWECSASTTESFSVRPLPVADFSIAGPRTFICGGDPVSLDGTASRDAYGDTVASYSWDLDGNPQTTESTSAITHSFVPNGPVSLEVSDGVCRASRVDSVPVGGPRTLFDLGDGSEGYVNAAVDIILVVDNSGSMRPFIEATQDAINDHFAAILDAHNLDYRVIAISGFGRSRNQEICFSSPLSDLNCGQGGGWWNRPPVFGPRFFHYDLSIGSRDGFNKVLQSYAARDQHNLAPNGWSQWLRPGVKKVFIEISDDDSNMGAAAFDSALRSLSEQHFGTEANRNYVWYGIYGMRENNPRNAPYEPEHPIVTQRCGNSTNAGSERQKLARTTGGLRFSICNPGGFDVVFERLAQSVIEIVRVTCEFDLTDVQDAPDPSTIAIEYTPGDSGSIELLLPVAGPEDCNPESFYRDGNVLRLCPDACTRVQSDTGASLALSGCHAP